MAVCNGYANAFKIMLDLAGIDNIIITGTVKTSKIGHAWNLIKIGGSYYHADATWDAGTVTRSEFLKSDDAVGKVKTWDKEAYPKAPKNYK
jgi:transglutaminase/protease-like cytokinesis protein 3